MIGLKFYIIVAAVLALAVIGSTWAYKIYTAGQSDVIEKVNDETIKLEEEFAVIERQPDNVVRSLERLRNNARRR